MNLNCFEIENVTLSLEYFNSLKTLSSAFLDYIKQYHFLSVEFHQKLLLLNTTYKDKISEISKKIAKKKLDFSQIFDFINSIPKILDSYIENLLFFTEEINKQINLFDDKNIEQIVLTCETQFKGFKKELKNNVEEIDKIKQNFFNEMEKTEIITYNYYYLQPKYNSNIPEKYRDENIYNIKEGEMDMKILDTKELENRYKEHINEGRKKENTFLENSKFHCENIKKFSNELMEKIKHLVLNFLMSLKNNFQLPEKEITSFLPKLIKLDKNIKFDKIMEQHFINQKIGTFLFNPEIYKMKIFQRSKKNKENNDIFNEIEDKIVELEDSIDRTYLILDEISLLTIQKMKCFQLINIKDLNLEEEKEKIKMNHLTIKLLSNIKKEYTEKEELLNITQNELDLIESLLEKRCNRIVFLHKLNKFRALGNYMVTKVLYSIISKYFIKILNFIKKDYDAFPAKNVIVLSQTYYMIEKEEKIYIQEDIKEHEIFKDNKFWENLFNFFMNKEIQKLRKSFDLNEEKSDEKSHYNKLAFGQIMTICNNMLEFGYNKDDIYKFIEPKIKYYNLDEISISSIKCVLGFENNDI
jgi:hypothetical protein